MATALNPRVKPIVSHAVGWVFTELSQSGQLLVDRMSYQEKGPEVQFFSPTIRHGMETGEDGETIKQTLETGVPHEYAQDAATFRWDFVTKNPILWKLVPDQEDSNALHLKIVFALKKIAGEFRSFVKDDPNPRRGTVEVLGPVTMVDANELYLKTVGKTARFHVEATMAAVSLYASDRRIFDRYASIVGKFRQPEFTAEEQAAYDAYPGKW